VVLTARCGLWTPEQFRDNLALVAEWAKNQRGRSWRPLEDTTVAAQLLYNARGDWAAWRRSTDFYDEGILLWLEADVHIRKTTQGKKSLDDFCRHFFGGPGGKISLKPFTFDELVAGLEATVPFDWRGLLTKRLTATTDDAPLDGLTRAGWKLGASDKQTDLHKENESDAKTIDATASLGLTLKQDGTVADVVPGKLAHRAGIGPGMKVAAVNSRRWSDSVFRAALAATRTSGRIELLLEQGDVFQTATLTHKEGERYPVLERIEGQPDLLAEIVRPLTPTGEAKEKESR
jgi:predicted metalloprotease with PDZ domain